MTAPARHRRRIVCVFPRHEAGLPNFTYAFRFFPDTRSLMPPVGLLTICAYLPAAWEVRFVDENVAPLREEDLAWADAVLCSGTHGQQDALNALAERAHRFGKLAVLGGPSVSACPEFYPGFDLLHLGELGDGTDALIERIERSVERADRQERFQTIERLPLEQHPIPAFHLIRAESYLLISIQWSSGCPYTCEFCDIPALYGRVPRYKSPQRLLRELDAILACGPLGGVFFVDDNLIGNKRALRELLPHVIEWQKRHGYPLRLIGECSLNVAQDREILAQLRESYFIELFLGIESAEEDALVAMSKAQNLRRPLVEAVQTINSYGISVAAGIILGLDTDTEQTVPRLLEFVEATQIPLVILNLLYAPPKTPLFKRLNEAGRLLPRHEVRDSNVRFLIPQEVVRRRWERAVERIYAPDALLSRYAYNARHVYPRRVAVPLRNQLRSMAQVRLSLGALRAAIYHLGIRSQCKRAFWSFALELVTRGQLDVLVMLGALSYHLIRFREEMLSGDLQACIHTEAAGR